MRLEGQAKAGYYPTPPKTLALLVEGLARYRENLKGGAALDPCAGEGEALFRVAEALGMTPYAVELDEERAKACKARLAPLGGKVVQGDGLRVEASGFSLLWLNPPYDWAGDGKEGRLELAFLRHYWPSLNPGGLLVLLVPEGVVEEAWRFLQSRVREVRAVRFPPEEHAAFRQVAVLAVKVSPYEPPTERKRLPVLEAEHLRNSAAAMAQLARVLPEEIHFHLRAARLEEVGEAARSSPLWEMVEALSVRAGMGFRPLLPLRQAHLALLIAGGMMDLREVEIEGRRYAVLGRLRKETVVHEEEDEEGEKRVEREVFRIGLSLLCMETGELLEVNE